MTVTTTTAAPAEVIELDVLVTGAGPTGLAAVNLLFDYSVKVALAEQRAGTSDDPKAISATDETLRVMQQIGVVDELKPEMLQDTGARYYGLKDTVLADVKAPVSSRGYRLGQPSKGQFDQPVMEALLLGAAEDRGIDLYFDTVVDTVENVADLFEGTTPAERAGVRVRATRYGRRTKAVRGSEDPAALHAPKPEETTTLEFRCRWLLACDGGKSAARKQMGIQLTGSTQVERWIVLDLLDVPGEPEPFASFHCNGERPVVVVPGVKGRRRYEFMLFEGEDEQQMLSQETITQLVKPFQDITTVTVRRAAVYTAHRRVAETYRKGHVVLAGDAAHLMPPFAGQGLNAGIRDAAGAAWRLAAVVRGEGTEALVDDYEAERRPHVTEMVKLSALIGRAVMNTTPWQARLRDAVVKGTRLVPPLNRWLTEFRFLKQPHYTEGTVVAAEASLPKPVKDIVGRALPQPWVSAPGTGEQQLDELLPHGWGSVEVDRRGDGTVTLTIAPVGPQPDPTGDHLPKMSSVGPVTVADRSGVFSDLVGHVLLLRPDHYVAAAGTAGQLDRLVASFKDKAPGL